MSLTLLTKEELEAGQAAYVASLLMPNKTLVQIVPIDLYGKRVARIARQAAMSPGVGSQFYCFAYVDIDGRIQGHITDTSSDSYAEAFALSMQKAIAYLSGATGIRMMP